MSDGKNAKMSDKYGFDVTDGHRVPRLVAAGDYTLSGMHQGSVHVERGNFTLEGILQGSLDVQAGVCVAIRGTQQGSVSVGRRAIVTVTGSIQGSTYVSAGGTVVIEPPGRLAGSLSNWGLVVVRGVFGGSYDGNGEFRLEGAGYVRQPEIRDGVQYYVW